MRPFKIHFDANPCSQSLLDPSSTLTPSAISISSRGPIHLPIYLPIHSPFSICVLPSSIHESLPSKFSAIQASEKHRDDNPYHHGDSSHRISLFLSERLRSFPWQESLLRPFGRVFYADKIWMIEETNSRFCKIFPTRLCNNRPICRGLYEFAQFKPRAKLFWV